MSAFKYLSIIFVVAVFTSTAMAQEFSYRISSGKNGWRTRVDRADGLKVLWWNLGCRDSSKVRQNLRALVNQKDSVSPDVLILGEYCANKLRDKKTGLLDLLLDEYPFSHRITEYTPFHNGNGMRVFSKFELTNVRKQIVSPGGWMSRMHKKKCARGKKQTSEFQNRRYAFPILKFNVRAGGKTYRLAGAHAPNPWVVMAKCIGKLRTGWHIVYGKSNPNYRYAQAVTADFKNKNQAIVIGDFNTPKVKKVGFFHFVGKAYQLLQRLLGTSIVRSNKPTAFGSFGGIPIDHAFASDDLRVRFAERIELAGSDHIPIYIVVK